MKSDNCKHNFKLCLVFNPSWQVGLSNADCLKYGSTYCLLNYEAKSSHTIKVRVTDNGSPPLSKTFSLTIQLSNINDQPRTLAMDKFKVDGLNS